MKFVIGEDLPRSTAEMLQALGHEAIDIRDRGLRGASDERIFVFAQAQNAVLITADLGFANILSFPLGTHHGIVVLRFPNELPNLEVNRVTQCLLAKVEPSTFPGNLIIITPAGARLRRHKAH